MMRPGLRTHALTAHVTSSVGWMGAVVVFLTLAIIGMTSDHEQRLHGAYLKMEPAGWFVLVPLAVAALVTGVIPALDTPWGVAEGGSGTVPAPFSLSSGRGTRRDNAEQDSLPAGIPDSWNHGSTP